MLLALTPNDSVTAVMSGAAATTNPTYFATWHESGAPSFSQPTGSLNGATAVTLIAAPGTGHRIVDAIRIYNADTAAVTVTLAKVVSGTSYTLAKTSIPVAGALLMDADGLRVVDASGQFLQNVTDDATVGVASNGAVATETGNGPVRKTSLALTDVSVTVGNTTGVSFGGTKIYDFPQGRILVLGSVLEGVTFDLTDAGNVTPIDAADGGDIAVGTTVAGDGTLTGTDVDLIPSTSIDPISSGVTGAALAASAQFDGTTTAVDAYFNVLIDDADVGDGASDVVLVSGTLTLHWCLLGDY